VLRGLSEVIESGWLNLSLCETERRIPLLGTSRVTVFIEIESPQLGGLTAWVSPRCTISS